MKRNGMQALDFHGPALVRGDLTYLHGAHYVHKVVALCFLPSAGLVPAALIDRHAEGFQGVDAALVMVASGARLLHRLWIGQEDMPLTPVLADPCGRLHRSLGVVVAGPAQRCHTFVIDRTGILRLRVSHDFVEHDLAVLRGIVGSSHFLSADRLERDEAPTEAEGACLPM